MLYRIGLDLTRFPCKPLTAWYSSNSLTLSWLWWWFMSQGVSLQWCVNKSCSTAFKKKSKQTMKVKGWVNFRITGGRWVKDSPVIGLISAPLYTLRLLCLFSWALSPSGVLTHSACPHTMHLNELTSFTASSLMESSIVWIGEDSCSLQITVLWWTELIHHWLTGGLVSIINYTLKEQVCSKSPV